MRMIKTAVLLALAAALVPGAAALADSDRNGDRDKRRGEGNPPAALGTPSPPATDVLIVKGSITKVSVPPTSIEVSVTKANAAAATALGLTAAGPVNPAILKTFTLDANTKVLRSTRGGKHDDARSKSKKGKYGGVSTDPATLAIGDTVKVTFGTTGLATAVIAKGARIKMVEYKIKAYVVALPAAGAALPVTVLVDPFKVNSNAAKALNPGNTTITGGSYDLAGTIPVLLDASTKVKVKGKGHWGHHRSGKGIWKLSRVKVGDRVEVEWKAPEGAKFWELPAREAEFKAKKKSK
jgi:hypothetical protein